MIGAHLDVSQRRTLALVGALVLLLLATVPLLVWWVSARSSAAFGDSEVLEANHLGAATLDVDVGQESAPFAAENLAPGDTLSGQLVVRNAGTLPLRFGVTATAGGDVLGSWLRFELWTTETICRPDQTDPRLVTGVVLSESPTVLVALSAGAGTAPVLRPGESTTLCLGASLPLTAPNEVQGRRLEVDLTIAAEHALEADR